MSEGVHGRDEFRERIIRETKRYVDSVVIPRLKPLLVILYGSFARGDWMEGSDVDILIVAEGLPDRYWDRWELVYELILLRPLDPHIYTPEEFMQMLRDGRMTALDALTEGIILHADEKFLEELRKTLAWVLKRRKKIGCAWVSINQ